MSRAHADNGPSMKRVRPAPMGRAFRVVKRTAHLTIEVTERPQVIKAVGTEGERRRRAKAPAAASSGQVGEEDEGAEASKKKVAAASGQD